MEAFISPDCEWHPNEKKVPPDMLEGLIDKVERDIGKWLSKKAKGYRRARFSDYRAVYAYDPDDENVVHILYIAHRDDKTYKRIEQILSSD